MAQLKRACFAKTQVPDKLHKSASYLGGCGVEAIPKLYTLYLKPSTAQHPWTTVEEVGQGKKQHLSFCNQHKKGPNIDPASHERTPVYRRRGAGLSGRSSRTSVTRLSRMGFTLPGITSGFVQAAVYLRAFGQLKLEIRWNLQFGRKLPR